MSEISKNINHGEINAGSAVIIGDDNSIKIQHILGNLQDYQNLEQDIAEAQEVFNAIALDKQEIRLKLSGILEAKKEKLENIKKAIEQAFEYISKITISTERLDKARALFLEGDILGALDILKDDVIQAAYQAILQAEQDEAERHSKKMEELEQVTKGIAAEWKMKAVLMTTQYEDKNWFEKTKGYYEEALEADRDVRHVFDYAYFLNGHNQKIEAMPFYEEAVEIRRSQVQSNSNYFLSELAMTLNNLAVLHYDIGELEKAEEEFEEALVIYRSLVQSNLETFLPDVAMTLNNLGLLHSAKNELEKAQREFEEALAIIRYLSQINPQSFLSDLAMTLNNLAVFHWKENELQKAEGEYEETLVIYQSLALSNPLTFQPYVANTLNNLGLLYGDKNEHDKAQAHYKDAITIYLSLTESNPQTFLPDLANVCVNLAFFFQNNKPDQEQSLMLVERTIRFASPFVKNLKFAQDVINEAKEVISKWGLDVEAFLKELEAENK